MWVDLYILTLSLERWFNAGRIFFQPATTKIAEVHVWNSKWRVVMFFHATNASRERLQLLTMGGFVKLNFANKCQVWFSTGCFLLFLLEKAWLHTFLKHDEKCVDLISILCCQGCTKEDLYSLNQFLVRPTTAPGDVSWLEICHSFKIQDTQTCIAQGSPKFFMDSLNKNHVLRSPNSYLMTNSSMITTYIVGSLRDPPPPRWISPYPKP